ncbi:uncharacterized protein PgNI_09128 [Pyricularia grisea]|uniref:Zn(2)-C6 fungal-type domain-containing protein n=1 Tax=Pyricularia grisea TaxID=148305 RepID=A0A6P8ATV6_PYRGI|nr:uncharacterized protein PgNI_09128 [Pyricularia grisea]TLD05555.1 hypothetical protein PgNI_09128 [Pyricularia grisea]
MCDETGPPCANCTIRRGSVCIYLVKQDTTPIMTWTPPSRSRHNHSSADQVIQDLRKQQRNLRITAPLHPGPTIPPPSYFSSSSSSSSGGGSSVPATPAQRDLELELVHRWSVRTWRGLQMIPACSGFLRVVLPRDMLRHDFLLSATLALAAADVAVSSSSGGSRGGSRVYADAAAAYVALAGWQFHRAVEELRDRRRRGLNGGGLGKENLYIFAQFGDMMGYYYMALPGSEVTSCGSLTSGVVAGGGGEDVVMTATLAPVPARPSIISRVHMAMQMFTGSMKTASLNWAWYLDSPTSARQAYEDYSPRLDAMRLLDAETLEAIKLMSSVANAVRVEVADGLAVSYNEIRSYCFAIGQTKYEFAEQLLQRMSGSFLSVPGVSGTFDSGFLDGIAEREPVALFVLMFWGVAIWRARTDGLWWIRTTGRELVDETCGLLVGGGIWGLEDVRKGVEWCRKEVGLNQLWEESEGFDDVVASRTDNSKT